jgi:hypothetical protein
VGLVEVGWKASSVREARSAIGIAEGARRAGARGEEEAPAPPPTPAAVAFNNVAAVLNAIAARVPAEVVGAFLLLAPILSAKNRAGQWFIAIVLLVVFTPALTYVGWAARETSKGHKPFQGWRALPYADAAIAMIAFAVWIAALPDSILNVVPGFQPAYGTVALVLAALVFYIVDQLRGFDWGRPRS